MSGCRLTFTWRNPSRPRQAPKFPRFKAQTRLWGYNIPKSGRLEELTSIAVETEKDVKDRGPIAETTPLESQRSWERQAEANIIERLEKAGLLAPPGRVDEVLNTVINNLIVGGNLGSKPNAVCCSPPRWRLFRGPDHRDQPRSAGRAAR